MFQKALPNELKYLQNNELWHDDIKLYAKKIRVALTANSATPEKQDDQFTPGSTCVEDQAGFSNGYKDLNLQCYFPLHKWISLARFAYGARQDGPLADLLIPFFLLHRELHRVKVGFWGMVQFGKGKKIRLAPLAPEKTWEQNVPTVQPFLFLEKSLQENGTLSPEVLRAYRDMIQKACNYAQVQS